ncbi:iron ABC transporter ATP-binding protein [uncultured Leifsonia sp.]|uniref:iron ABC transporter ATP-binding protein n=1 Tax=uncultured Leifsonia sp. TaxID=340359 RepID=UPI0025CB7F54|nr:iron ABC transporter ATP-binding protein [uncultured Leifsonia sp.]
MQQHTVRTLAALALAAAAVTLAGCTPTAKPAPTSSASAGGGSTSKPIATPTPTPTPTMPPTPVTLTCDQLLTPDQIYAYNPNFTKAPNYTTASSSLERKIVDWKGVACGWQNETSGDIVQIAVAQPPADQLENLKNEAITAAQPVPTYGTPPQVEGYFKAGASGQVQIFRGPYWIVAESTTFTEPGDPAPLMQSVLGNLPAS